MRVTGFRHTGAMASDQVVPEGRRYGDHRPYPDPPAHLADLTGPTDGLIELPITIDWGPKRVYDMGRDAERRIVYERVLREAATPDEVARYVNGAVLVLKQAFGLGMGEMAAAFAVT